MDLFELSAKIELDDSGYKKSVEDAAQKAEEAADSIENLGESAKKAAKDIPYLDDSLDDVEYSGNEAGITIEKVTDSVDDLGDKAKKTKKETDGLGDSAEKSKDSFLGAMVKADLFARAIEKAGEMAVELAKYIWNLDEATEEYRVSQGKLNTAFKVSGLGADNAKKSFQALYRATGDIDRATEASQLLSQLARDTQDVTDWTTIATGVVGTFGDSLPIESLIESANETANVGKVVGTLADALNWAGNIGEDEFNAMLAECETQEERVQLITDTLMDTYSEAAGVFEDTSKSVIQARDAFLEIQEAESEAGEGIEEFKNSLTYINAGKAKGFFAIVDLWADGLTNISEKSASAANVYNDFVSSIETRIRTGSIEDATEAVEELRAEMNWLLEHPFDYAFTHEGFLDTLARLKDFNYLLDLGEGRLFGTGEAADEFAESTDAAADSVENLEEAVEPVIATAGDLAVQLEGTGYSAEEASGRLQTYADAATDLFGQISTESELSYEDVLTNLEHNWQATNDFANNLQSLAGSLPPALYETFAAGGPQAYAGIVSMLAEANTGADEGLAELNRLYELGGDAAIKAFITSLSQMPEGAQDPAKVVAAQMDEDTSMETASAAAVERADTAMAEAVESAGFDSSGQAAMDYFINGLELKRQAVIDKAQSIASSAKGAIDNVLNNIPSGGRGSGRAGGLDIVPYNGYPAVLHAGEAVLTAREAKEWRSGNTDNSRQIVIHQHINTIPMTPAQLAAASEAYFEQAVWSL